MALADPLIRRHDLPVQGIHARPRRTTATPPTAHRGFRVTATGRRHPGEDDGHRRRRMPTLVAANAASDEQEGSPRH
jgi:hypothetical protein